MPLINAPSSLKNEHYILPNRPRKLFGVRKVIKSSAALFHSKISNDDNDNDNGEVDRWRFKHGIENPIVANLIVHNPRLLGQILSTRYTTMGKPISDFVMSLFVQGQKDSEKMPRKRSRTSSTSSSALDTHCQTVNIASDAAEKHGKVMDLQAESIIDADPDMIDETEFKFLIEVLEDQRHLKRRRCFGNNSKPLSRESLISAARIDDFESANRDECGKDDDEGNYNLSDNDCDDLEWITREMERDWIKLLKHAGREDIVHASFQKSNRPSPSSSVLACPADIDRIYKAYLTLGRRNQCELGHFETPEEAAFMHDMYAIARRTLGIKVMKDLFLRKRVKALRATYVETNCAIIQQQSSHKAHHMDMASIAKKAHTCAAKTLDKIVADTYFSSDKVLYTDLNSFPSTRWRPTYPFPIHEDSTFTLGVNREVIVPERLSDTASIRFENDFLLDAEPCLSWLRDQIEEITAAQQQNDSFMQTEETGSIEDLENSISLEIMRLKNQLALTSSQEVIYTMANLRRLAQLESGAKTLFAIEKKSNESQHERLFKLDAREIQG